jgi:uncharacterized repeat protein (TIGR03803 family)
MRFLQVILCSIVLAGCSHAIGGSTPLPADVPNGGASASSAAKQPRATQVVLKSFTNSPDGANPHAGMVVAINNGGLYGTTLYGGTHGDGTVFQMNAAGVGVLYNFAGSPDGSEPVAGLVRVDSNVYGTTQFGGSSTNCPNGCGTVFKVTPAGVETVLHSFTGSPDGRLPYGSLVAANGRLYGTTAGGGSKNKGTVFRVMIGSGVETVLHSFTNTPDGAVPYAGLIKIGTKLYGTTFYGGTSNDGTVFWVTIATGAEHVLHSFANSPDGAKPQGGVTVFGGALYGTTVAGGNSFGTVFTLHTGGAGYHVIHAFAGSPTDGRYPAADLLADNSAPYTALYGTTYRGGSNDAGTAFKISASGVESVLHSFTGGPTDGGEPEGGFVIFDNPGTPVGHTLYSTTQLGGTSNSCASGCGIVYQLSLP